MTHDDLAAFRTREHLPERFQLTAERVCRPLADLAQRTRAALGRAAVIGLCGAQGSGKSTVAGATCELLRARGLSAVSLSIDDVYLSHEARARLDREVHHLLAVRGPPGTHDVTLACEVLDALARSGCVRIPSFDKARDEPRPAADWPSTKGPLDVVIFEGWCVGARPEPSDRLENPVNALERDQDPQGVWRRYVNEALAERYPALFGRLDALVLLAAPGFDVVRSWRTEQEHKLRARTGGGMSDADVARFIQHYERLTRWMLEEMPARADWTVRLAEDRSPL